MGLFDEQLNARQENDREAIKRSLGRLGAAVTGRVQSSVSYHCNLTYRIQKETN